MQELNRRKKRRIVWDAIRTYDRPNFIASQLFEDKKLGEYGMTIGIVGLILSGFVRSGVLEHEKDVSHKTSRYIYHIREEYRSLSYFEVNRKIR